MWRWLVPLACLAGLLTAAGWGWHAARVRGEWREAQTALDRHDLAGALAHLDRYLEDRPDDPAARFLAARTARRLGRYAEAERHLTRCQEVAGVTDATRLEWDLFRVQQGDLGETHTRLRLTVAPEHPDAALVLEALARGYLACDRLSDALEACDLWAARAPDEPWPRLWRGGVYERLVNFEQALADYRRALELAPDDRDTRLSIGSLLARGRQPGPAAEHFRHVLRKSPHDHEAIVGLAGCLVDEGRPEEAVGLLARVPADDPVAARIPLVRGRAALEQQDAPGAEAWLARAVREAPDDPEALYALTLALRAQGKHADADRLAPRLEALRKDLARLDALIRSVGRSPDEARARHEAGLICLRIGRDAEGERWLQSALRARGDHRPVHAALAEHFAGRGDPRADSHRRLAQGHN